MNTSSFVSVKWLGKDGSHQEQTCSSPQIADQLRAHLRAQGLTVKPTLVVGSQVGFQQGIYRNGRVIKIGPRRAHVQFAYRNGKIGVAKIPLRKLTKNVGLGWSAARYWSKKTD